MRARLEGNEVNLGPDLDRAAGAAKVGRLGYGCAMLMARLNRNESRRLLDHAYAMGITHFDTARLYGYGEAESVLGSFLKQHRSAVTVTTKVGILPPRRTAILSAAKTAARVLVALNPKLRVYFRAKAEALTTGGKFDIPAVTKSVETSLRELKTDYVDYLLLHECTIDDLQSPELLKFMQQMRADGKVRHFGLATDVQTVREALNSNREFTGVLQIPNSSDARDLRTLSGAKSLLITHSVLGANLNRAHAALHQNDSTAAVRWRLLGKDRPSKAELAKVMLRFAMSENPDGIVLVSSTSEANITNNCQTASLALPIRAEERLVLDSLFMAVEA